jgi:hypothetical protein
MEADNRFTAPYYVVDGEGLVENCPAVPNKPDNNVRWIERSTTYHLPNVTCSYEASFPNFNADGLVNFGFEYQWQKIPYSLRHIDRFMVYCVVKSVHADYSKVISKGDIVLKLNEELLFFQHGETVPAKNDLAKKLVNRKSSIDTLRFLRVASNSPNSMISPAEIISFAQDKFTTAKFTLKLSKDNPSRFVLENINTEANTPTAVRRMMQAGGQLKPLWTSVPVFKEGPMDARIALGRSIQNNQSSTATHANLGNLLGSLATIVVVPTMSVHNSQEIGTSAGEVYHEKTKYVAIFSDGAGDANETAITSQDCSSFPTSLQAKREQVIQKNRINRINKKRSLSMLYNIGRYDNEEEAKKNIQRAKNTSELYQTFDPYYFIKEITKKSAPMLSLPSTSAPQGSAVLTINMASVPSAAAITK